MHAHQALNCVVDDSALVAGVKDNSTNNIKKWINEGLINVFVPLYALERLNALRKTISPVSVDARKALEWLDHITESTGRKSAGRVQIQGPDDHYQTWQEVEQYYMPDTPFTLQSSSNRVDALSKVLDQSLHVNGGTATSISSPFVEQVTGKSVDHYASNAATHGVPSTVRPLLNFVVWCTNHQDATFTGSRVYILLTNDPVIQKQAGKFGARAKLLGQVANILSKDRATSNVDGNTSSDVTAEQVTNGTSKSVGEDEDDEEEIVFDPSKRPGSSRNSQNLSNSGTLLDPDHFGREQKIDNIATQVPTPHHSSRARGNFRRGNVINDRGISVNNRINGNTSRPGSSPAPKAPLNAPTGPAAASRGNGGSMRGRGALTPGRAGRGETVQRPIDPDSYARPSPSTNRGRGRANTRRLWEPK